MQPPSTRCWAGSSWRVWGRVWMPGRAWVSRMGLVVAMSVVKLTRASVSQVSVTWTR